MQRKHSTVTWCQSLGISLAFFCLIAVPATAQHESNSTQSLSIPSQDQLIELQASLPNEVKVGETFTYDVNITNSSENVVLLNVEIEQIKNDGINIESAQIKGEKQRSGKQKQKENQQQNQQDEKQKNQSETRQNVQQSSAQSSDDSNQRTWTIDELKPGESRMVSIKATSQKEGQLRSCLAVKSYTPVLCLMTKAVKADLELVKNTPDESNVCEQLEWEYFVKNSGSGDPGKFTVHDDLPQGLETISGEKRLEFQIDGIAPGDVRKFVAKLQPTEPGNYESAARIERDGNTTKSQKVGTKVIGSDLAVAIEGPQARYINRMADYKIRVTNHGEAPAQDVRLAVRYPGELQLVHAGDPQSSNTTVSYSSSGNNQGKPRLADKQQASKKQEQITDSKQQIDSKKHKDSRQNNASQKEKAQTKKNKQNKKKQDQQQKQASSQQQAQNRQSQSGQSQSDNMMEPSEARSWELGALDAGETMEVTFTVRGGQQGNAKFEAVAMFACDAEKDSAATSYASTKTEYIALPALMVAVMDNKDPVPVDEQVEYTVIVGNEGQAMDQDIRVSVKLPEELKFVKGDGSTEVSSDGQNIQFKPVKELRAGERARWTLTTKAESKGDVRLEVEVESKHLSRATTTEEPTVLFAGGKASAK